MKNIKRRYSSVRVRLFLMLSVIILSIVLFLIVINTFVYKPFFFYAKQKSLLNVYNSLNAYYNNPDSNIDIDLELEKAAVNNGIDIIIKTQDNIIIYTSNKDFLANITQTNIQQESIFNVFNKDNTLYKDEKTTIKQVKDKETNLEYIILSGTLDNGYSLTLRLPNSSVEESAKISNTFLYSAGLVIIVLSGIIIIFVSKRFAEPISELEEIATKMSHLDFSTKYEPRDVDDEINNLGKSINTMSYELEKTIKQLKKNNTELEKDIEEKAKIDEMRKQFISDVSHELKTPIALIQGYAEGLQENINTDEESRKFYVDVILDEANKMDNLVKKLLELMKLEYKTREFNNNNFDIVELIREVIRKSKVMIEEEKLEIRFDANQKAIVNADEFYIEQVVTNYLTNAIKNIEEINGEKYIEIKINEVDDKIRISIFNTGKNIAIEDLSRIWNRFYKVDTSRNRESGGSGIGLAFVKAIMNNYQNKYGVDNKINGVEFYFELDKEKEE